MRKPPVPMYKKRSAFQIWVASLLARCFWNPETIILQTLYALCAGSFSNAQVNYCFALCFLAVVNVTCGQDHIFYSGTSLKVFRFFLGVYRVLSKISFPLVGWCSCAHQPCGEGGDSDWLQSWKLGIQWIFKIPTSQGSLCCVKLHSFYEVNFSV